MFPWPLVDPVTKLVTNSVSCTATFVQRAGTVALTGAWAPFTVGGRPAPLGAPVPVPAGAPIEVGHATRGVRCYLAFGGGIAVPAVLGSRSTDTLSWLGPPVLRDGQALPLGDPGEPSTVDFSPLPRPPAQIVLRVRLGPRADWFADPGELLSGRYTIRVESNRIGARLDGPSLTRAVVGELPSEGIVLGAVQVPASGQPLVFLADHPTTGGYPVIGVVAAEDLPALAQGRPGDTVRFRGPEQ